MQTRRPTFKPEFLMQFLIPTEHEKPLLTLYDSDGMVEILIGAYLLVAGLCLASHSILDMLAMYLPLVAPLIIPMWRRKITFARIGYSDVIEAYDKRWRFWLVVVFFFLPLVFIGITLLFDWLGWLSPGKHTDQPPQIKIMVGGVIALFLVAIGFLRRMPRLYPFAVLLVALVAVTAFQHIRFGYAVSLTGAALLGLGLLRLSQFRSEHPRRHGDPMPKPDFEKVQTGIFLRFRQGGMTEFYIAGMMLFMIVYCASDWNHWAMLVGGLGFLSFLLLGMEWWKRGVLNPRLGYVKVPHEGGRWSKQTAQMMIFMAVAMIAADWVCKRLGQIHFAGLQENSDHLMGIKYIVWFGVFFAASAIADKVAIWGIMAVMLLSLPFAALYLGLSEIYAFGLIATVSLVLGMIKLQKFLRNNPVMTESEDNPE
jgi:hypothetical protein